MKIKNLFMCMVLGAFTLTSCNDSDDVKTNTSEESVNLYVKFDLGVATKADVDKMVIDGVTVTQFPNGGIFFADANGDILCMAIIDDSPAGTVTAAQIQAGYLFTDIDASAEKVYVVGNFDFTGKTYANIAAVQAETVDIVSQTDNDFGVNAATLYGAGTLVPVTPGSPGSEGFEAGAEREAIFEIAPIIARMEIDKIETLSTSDIEDFKLAGIYINNYYTDMSVIGTIVPADLVHNGTLSTDFDKYLRTTATQTNGKYADAIYEYLFDDGDVDGAGDYQGISMTAAISHTPANDTWAYNVFANGSAVPHIVLHFTDLRLKNGGTPVLRPNATAGIADGEAYLTITGYNAAGTSADQPILGGNVYELASVIFDEDDLDDYPYENDDKNPVYVRVEVKPWNVIAVDWK